MTMAAAYEEIEEKVRDKCVVVYTRSWCGPCQVVKPLLNKMDACYDVVELDKIPQGDALGRALYYKTGRNTVPQVFINGSCVGGAHETMQLHKFDRLRELIGECDPKFRS